MPKRTLLLCASALLAIETCAHAGALKLDGNGDYVLFPNTGIPSGSGAFTIEAWINPTSVPGAGDGGTITFWGNQTNNQANGFRLRGPSGTRHFFWSNDHDENFGVNILPDTTGQSGWHHVALTYNGSQTQWYWNGAPLGGPRTAGAVNVAAVNHRIGSRLDAEYFDGYLDEVRIWNKGRSAAEIAADFGKALTGNEANLVAYFDFEGGLTDRAGGNNNGSPVGNASVDGGSNAPVSSAEGPVITSFTATPPARYEGETATLAWEIDVTEVVGTLAVEIRDGGGSVIHTTSDATGSIPALIGDTGGTAQTLTYTLRASESGGQMISREASADISASPGIPTATAQSLSTVATTPLPITLSGSDPNSLPNPSLAFAVLTPPLQGSLSGTAPNLTYTANGGFTGIDTLEFKVNDGKYDSSSATITIDVVPAPTAPTDLRLSTTNIGEGVANGGLIATLLTTDPNLTDTHSYSLVAGAGSTHNGLFAIVGNQLRAATTFAGQVGNPFSIRVRTTDNGGLFHEESFVLTVIEVLNVVTINEIHFNPPENPVRQEFIELYNPSETTADLGGWRLSSAVDFAFPEGTTIPPGGYLVIGEDPPTLLSTLSASALGPFTGNLSGDGETVRLRDANDNVVDEVDFKVGFPWPIGADGNGPSIELIHPSLDNALGSSWRPSLSAPSPGAQNSVFAINAAPNIRKVEHSPAQPTAQDSPLITATITDPEGVASVTLEYRIVAPGAYVPARLPLPIVGNNINTNLERPANPAYESGWISLSMRDDGTGGDVLAGDDVYSASLPANPHRTLVRYRITIEDGLGLSARVPYSDDPSLNFAYFVYDGVPAYEGTSAAIMANTLPVYQLVTRPEDYSECFAYDPVDEINQGTQARFLYNWDGALVYEGIVHDNVTYRLRGANGRYQSAGKRSMRVRLNDGHHLQARDRFGRKYDQPWRTLTLGKCNSNRLTLTFGLNEAVNFYLFNKVGVPASDAQWLHWRVVDGADEAPDASHGDFHGFYLVTETYDVGFLEGHGLEKGNLYKLINQTTDWAQQQRYQGAFAPSNGADHNLIENQLDGADSAAYISAHVNLEKWNRSHALVQAIRHYDYWPSANKNMAYYFEPPYLPENDFNGRLWILPWDTDSTWGPTYNSGHDVVYNALFSSGSPGGDGNSTPELWPEYFNNVRELRDLLWQPDQVYAVIEEFAAMLAPLEAADAARWKGAPADAGNYSGLHGPGLTSLAAYVQDMKNFAFVGGAWDGGSVGAGGQAAFLDSYQASNGEGAQIPNTPSITYTGAPGFPTDGIAFQSSAFSDPQGAGSFGAIEWRVAEITDPSAPAYVATDPFKLEWDATWTSGELGIFTNSVTVPTVAVRSGHTYRARVRHKDATGRWSHWSAPVEFTATLPDISAYLSGLVLSEVMYHPANPTAAELQAGFVDDNLFEYLELRNVGPVPLDLTNVRFTKGVDFDFLGSDVTTLAPGAFALVVANRAAFEMRYGAGLPVAGEWQATDSLNNGGEQLKLSFGAGDALRDFVYDDSPPWPTSPDGGGFSLTLVDPLAVPDHGIGGNWRPSFVTGGTPGVDDPGETYASWRESIFGPGNPPLSGELDDADGDGIVNVLEYVLVSNPLNSGSTPPIEAGVEDVGGIIYLTLTYTRLLSATDAAFDVEVSTDLAQWNGGPAYVTAVAAPIANGDGTVTISQRSLIPSGSIPHEYIHLRVTLNP